MKLHFTDSFEMKFATTQATLNEASSWSLWGEGGWQDGCDVKNIKYSRVQSGRWGGATLGAGRHMSLHPPPIPLVYTANLIGVDPSMCIPLCTIL